MVWLRRSLHARVALALLTLCLAEMDLARAQGTGSTAESPPDLEDRRVWSPDRKAGEATKRVTDLRAQANQRRDAPCPAVADWPSWFEETLTLEASWVAMREIRDQVRKSGAGRGGGAGRVRLRPARDRAGDPPVASDIRERVEREAGRGPPVGVGSAPAASPTRLNRRPPGDAQDEGIPLRRSAPHPAVTRPDCTCGTARPQRALPMRNRAARRGSTRAAVQIIVPFTPVESVSRARSTVVMPPTARMARSQAPAFRHASSSCTCTRQWSHTASPEMPASSRPVPVKAGVPSGLTTRRSSPSTSTKPSTRRARAVARS